MARNKYPEETVKLILDTAERLFTEKGFERTSLQDIMNATKLSKGAIYHHFVSKDDIFIKICDNNGKHTAALLTKIRDDKSINGKEKLKSIFTVTLNNTVNRKLISMQPYMISNPKLLAAQTEDILKEVAPNYICPILEQGNADGSLSIAYPKETAEMLMILANLWLNPLLIPSTNQEVKTRCKVFVSLLDKIGIEFSETELINAYTEYNNLLVKK